MIAPTLTRRAFSRQLDGLVAPIAMGGLWLALFAWQLE